MEYIMIRRVIVGLYLIFFMCLPAYLFGTHDGKEEESQSSELSLEGSANADLWEDVVIWYVHLQKNWVPYSDDICQDLEMAYINNPRGQSGIFYVESQAYFVSFSEMKQNHGRQSNTTRHIRRVKYSCLPKSRFEKSIPLTYNEIMRIGGHTKAHLSQEERREKKIINEDSESNFYLNHIVEDSFSPKRKTK